MPLPRAQLARTRFDAIGIFSNLFSAEAFFRQIRFGFNRFFFYLSCTDCARPFVRFCVDIFYSIVSFDGLSSSVLIVSSGK